MILAVHGTDLDSLHILRSSHLFLTCKIPPPLGHIRQHMEPRLFQRGRHILADLPVQYLFCRRLVLEQIRNIEYRHCRCETAERSRGRSHHIECPHLELFCHRRIISQLRIGINFDRKRTFRLLLHKLGKLIKPLVQRIPVRNYMSQAKDHPVIRSFGGAFAALVL